MPFDDYVGHASPPPGARLFCKSLLALHAWMDLLGEERFDDAERVLQSLPPGISAELKGTDGSQAPRDGDGVGKVLARLGEQLGDSGSGLSTALHSLERLDYRSSTDAQRLLGAI